MNSEEATSPFRILSLDGGGAKGAFTLGVLQEFESQFGGPLHEHFDLIYGTSTGAIIATYLALGFSVSDIYSNYLEIIPRVMSKWTKKARSEALRDAADKEFGRYTFHDTRCRLAIVATRCDLHRPLIFKSHADIAHSDAATFVPGFGVSLADCLLASAAASPFFERQRLYLRQPSGDSFVEAIDGGFVANNPCMFSLIDAVGALNVHQERIRLCSIGTGTFPQKKRLASQIAKRVWLLSDAIALLEETLESNSNSADFIRGVLFPKVCAVRINPTMSNVSFSTDLLEADIQIIEQMYDCGIQCFNNQRDELLSIMGGV
jgi:patatin-like phospholipase/acyl hydrolase